MRIDVEIGYKIVENGKPTRYFAGQTNEGMCYKDVKAYEENSDICYIPECEFDGEGWSVEYRDGLGYVREEIEQIVTDELDWNYERVPRCKEFEELIAQSILNEVEWESIGVALDRIDLDEEWAYYYANTDILSK